LALAVGAIGLVSHAGALGSSHDVVLYCLTATAFWGAFALLYGIYDHIRRRPETPISEQLTSVFHVSTIAVWAAFSVVLLGLRVDIGVWTPVALWMATVPFIAAMRVTTRQYARRHERGFQPTIILGAGTVGQMLAQKIAGHPETGLRVVGLVDSSPLGELLPAGLELLGPLDDLEDLVDEHGVKRVLIAFSSDRPELLLPLVRRLNELRVQVDVVPRLFEVIGSSVNLGSIEGIPLLGIPTLGLSRGARLVKRAFDLVAALFALVVLAPTLVLTAVAIKLGSRGPVLFRQLRVGANGELFRIYKFRSMLRDADASKASLAHLNVYATKGDPRMFKIEDDPRATRVGRLIRLYYLDELPQLFNVLLGNMSLVGPRPLIPEEDRHVVDWQRHRLSLKPGMTGLWQVVGGNRISFDEMVKLDYLYVTGWTLAGDIKLLLQTFSVIARRRSRC
jgi:exopolysaccharide biosynthesis polyprenyl glycosylphosphotransferase